MAKTPRYFLGNPLTRMIASRHETLKEAKRNRRDVLEIVDTLDVMFNSADWWE